MDALVTTCLILGLMAVVVLLFRTVVRRPARASLRDPPGVRTVVVFSGKDPDFFRDDRPEQPFVGIRLFQALCDGLTGGRMAVENRGTMQNAHRAECLVGTERFALVLEWIEHSWVASVEWIPQSRAEMRHLALTGQVFAPPDSSDLRHLLTSLDNWLKRHPKLTDVNWYRKEKWIAEDTSDPGNTPLEPVS